MPDDFWGWVQQLRATDHHLFLGLSINYSAETTRKVILFYLTESIYVLYLKVFCYLGR